MKKRCYFQTDNSFDNPEKLNSIFLYDENELTEFFPKDIKALNDLRFHLQMMLDGMRECPWDSLVKEAEALQNQFMKTLNVLGLKSKQKAKP